MEIDKPLKVGETVRLWDHQPEDHSRPPCTVVRDRAPEPRHTSREPAAGSHGGGADGRSCAVQHRGGPDRGPGTGAVQPPCAAGEVAAGPEAARHLAGSQPRRRGSTAAQPAWPLDRVCGVEDDCPVSQGGIGHHLAQCPARGKVVHRENGLYRGRPPPAGEEQPLLHTAEDVVRRDCLHGTHPPAGRCMARSPEAHEERALAPKGRAHPACVRTPLPTGRGQMRRCISAARRSCLRPAWHWRRGSGR